LENSAERWLLIHEVASRCRQADNFTASAYSLNRFNVNLFPLNAEFLPHRTFITALKLPQLTMNVRLGFDAVSLIGKRGFRFARSRECGLRKILIIVS
jgi:hypothetical protein